MTLIKLLLAVNSVWTLSIATLIADFNSTLVSSEAYFSAILFNKAASDAFCSNTTLSSATVTVSVSSFDDTEARPTSATEALNEADSLTEAEALSENDSDTETDSLTKVDALSENDSDTDADWLADSTVFSETKDESDVDTEPRTKLSVSARVSFFNSEAVATSLPASSARAVYAIDVAPKTAPAVTIPFKKPRLVISLTETTSSWTSATTVSSAWPWMTLRRPKFEVAARNQFFPDLISLKRVTRSISRNSPFERLKNMYYWPPVISNLDLLYTFYHTLANNLLLTLMK